MSFKIDAAARYLKSHEWARPADDGSGDLYCGISDHAQEAMSDLVYVELPRVGTKLKAGDVLGVVESVKAASDVYCPVAGTVVAVNTGLEASPETINKDAYGEGWMARVKPDDPAEFGTLMDASGYDKLLSETEH